MFDRTARLLSQVRQGVLSAYEDPEDPRIDQYGRLGVGKNHADNLERLKALAEVLGPPLESGEIALVASLGRRGAPGPRGAHADRAMGKVGATAARQVTGKSLEEVRADSRRMLQRITRFGKACCGAEEIPAFGFDVPAPARRPVASLRK